MAKRSDRRDKVGPEPAWQPGGRRAAHPVRQPPFVERVPGELRRFDSHPVALPPFPCRLCDMNFGSRDAFQTHVDKAHCGTAECRKRLFYLASGVDGVRAVTPQEWRVCVEAFAEELVTGAREWPSCDDAGAQNGSGWWREADGAVGVTGHANLEAIGPQPPADRERRQSTGRRAVRHQVACCVCARRDWADRREWVRFWHDSFLSAAPAPTMGQKRDGPEGGDGAGEVAQAPCRRDLAQALLSPARYYRRWRFTGPRGEEGGIPLQELEASSVRDPRPHGGLWLLHKRLFRMVARAGADGRRELVADPDQEVPICTDCRCSLTKPVPSMPKFALANDLWMGRPPPELAGLSTGARLLLPLARGVVKRYNCLTDSGKWKPVEQRIKGYVGNVVAFPQADGGCEVLSLPPRGNQLLDHVRIVFSGPSTGELRHARVAELEVSRDKLRVAYELLARRNAQYARVRWDDQAAEELEPREGQMGLPPCLAKCVTLKEVTTRPARARQKGPADAVETGVNEERIQEGSDAGQAAQADELQKEAEEEQEKGMDAEEGSDEDERGEFAAAVADADMQCDQDRAWKRVEVSLRRAEMLAAQKARVETAMRRQEGMQGYEDKDLQRALQEETTRLREAVGRVDLSQMQEHMEKAQQQVQETRPPPGVARQRWRVAGGGVVPGEENGHKLQVVVPTGVEPVSMFAPSFWSAFAPLTFPYGDGVFGLERDAELTYVEWCQYLMDREELAYEVDECDSAGAGGTGATDAPVLPRWRADADLLTAQYCLWRRKGYIQGARHFVRRQQFRDSLQALARLKPEELYHACAVLGRGAGVKEALQSEAVAPDVKRALRSMLLCNANVVGSDAHRTVLRHVSNSYRLLFGPPLVFTTVNPADTRSLVMSLLFEGAEVGRWRLLEEDAPAMPSAVEMLRRVAADPVSQATMFHLMIELFLEHVVGALPPGHRERVSDGVVASTAPGVFGVARAFMGPVETQGRGGLHPHMHVWVLQPMVGNFLALLRAGAVPDYHERLESWRRNVLAKVGSIQFDSVEEAARQLGVRAAPLPLSDRQRGKAYMDGRLERDDLLLEVPLALAESTETTRAVPQGPRRLRGFAPLADPEPDPHERECEYPRCRHVPMT